MISKLLSCKLIDLRGSLLFRLFDEVTRLPLWEKEIKTKQWPYGLLLRAYSVGVRALYISPDLEKHIKKGRFQSWTRFNLVSGKRRATDVR